MREYPDSLLVQIEIDDYSNYGELIQKIDIISCKEKTAYFQLENDSIFKNLVALHNCSTDNSIVDYSLRNIIGINNDSIIVNRNIKTKFDKIDSILKLHYLNYGKDWDYSANPEKAAIMFYADSITDIKKIKKKFNRITESYLKFVPLEKDSIKLKIIFQDYPMELWPIPPLPKK